jgi:hypothetical protein
MFLGEVLEKRARSLVRSTLLRSCDWLREKNARDERRTPNLCLRALPLPLPPPPQRREQVVDTRCARLGWRGFLIVLTIPIYMRAMSQKPVLQCDRITHKKLPRYVPGTHILPSQTFSSKTNKRIKVAR